MKPKMRGGSDASRSSEPRHSCPAEDDDARSSPTPPAAPGSLEAARRSALACMLRRVFEAEPLTCPRCKVVMEIVSWISEPEVINRILRHRRERGQVSPLKPRAPPAA